MDKVSEVAFYPRLDTVLIVEEFIKEHGGEYKKSGLWEHLPEKIKYQTFCIIFDYLLASGKIALDLEDKVAWIWNSDLVKRYLHREDLVIRNPSLNKKPLPKKNYTSVYIKRGL